MIDITELTSVQKNANIHRLSRLIAYAPNDELRQLAVEVEQYTEQLIEALEKAQQRNGELETYSKTALEFREAARDENRHLKLELEIAEKRIAELESRTVTPVTYSENTDADHCRKWGWEQVKGEVSTEGWTTGDNITYFGFFCWGWDMRRQYNEQRTVTVKMPKLKMLEDYLAEVAVEERKAILLGVRMEFHRALNAEGIKWEAE